VASPPILVNRAPVLTLWAAIVAERSGYPRATALTLGKAVAGLNAQSKGRRLGIYEAPPSTPPDKKSPKPAPSAGATVLLLGRSITVLKTPEGLRAMVKGNPERPASVERYLAQKFGAALPETEAAMRELAAAWPPKRLEEIGFALYERFRPEIPEGVKGWGAKGQLDLARLKSLAKQR
jgi:hypothetical protein